MEDQYFLLVGLRAGALHCKKLQSAPPRDLSAGNPGVKKKYCHALRAMERASAYSMIEDQLGGPGRRETAMILHEGWVEKAIVAPLSMSLPPTVRSAASLRPHSSEVPVGTAERSSI